MTRSFALVLVVGSSNIGVAADAVDFARDVRPILAAACFSCHGADVQKGGLRLDRKVDALKGGDSGPAIVPGKSAESLLAKLIAGDDADRPMPPKKENRLTAAQVATVRKWIDAGATWPDDGSTTANPGDWWSLKPIAKVTPPTPTAADAKWVRNPIDAFVAAKLRENGLAPSPGADRRTLIRRLSFDLIGLPPLPDEVAAFEADPAADAYEKLVDKLLADPGYGERWARHWLDVVHYGDTHGYDKDQPRPNAYPYRDYVIRSLNADKPYARFVREQIAGDVLYPGTADGVTALGFIAAGPWDLIGHAEVPESKTDGKIARHLDRDDMVANTIGTFASLTVHCAQCHNHKFDPIPQEDYYRLQAVFAALDRADRPYYTDPAAAKKAAELLPVRAKLVARQRELATSREPKPSADIEKVNAELARVTAELAKYPAAGTVYAATVHHGTGNFTGTGPQDGKPRPVFLLHRGNVTQPKREVTPAALSGVPGPAADFDLPAGHAEGDRRAALAKWLTDDRHPLTWRSIVNRTWQYHFGRGIVATPNDFGRMGQLPTHPELLDWLAADFRDGGQSLKKLHRLIVTSAAYRQTSATNAAGEKLDADNQYLWRQTRRKLDAEAVRDAVLQVAGKLDRTMYGPAFQDFKVLHPEHSPHYEYHLADPNDPKAARRSVYRFLARSKPQPFMAALDCADPSMQVDKRNETLSPAQALALLNNKLVLAMSGHLAARAEKTPEPVATAFRLALGRGPSASEKSALADHAKAHGLPAACRVIFNLNEFVFVD